MKRGHNGRFITAASFMWRKVIERYDELRLEYNQRLSAEIAGKHGA